MNKGREPFAPLNLCPQRTDESRPKSGEAPSLIWPLLRFTGTSENPERISLFGPTLGPLEGSKPLYRAFRACYNVG